MSSANSLLEAPFFRVGSPQFTDFGMSGKCVKTDKAVSCDAICERDCFVCFAESLRGGATQQGGERR